MIHSFLLIGQSNAAGRGFIETAPALDNCGGRLLVLRNGRWQGMYRPVNPDRPFSGTCFAESFAKAYADEHPDAKAGIIPCADGGTMLEQWMPGELLFENAVNCAKLAMRTSHLMGILWHQGEADCKPEKYPTYAVRFLEMINALKAEIGMPDIPVVVGGLGDFLTDCTHDDCLKNYHYINDQLKEIPNECANCGFAGADGLGANPDNLHFSAEALNEFGLRYYEVFRKLNTKNSDFNSEIEFDSKRTEMEML